MTSPTSPSSPQRERQARPVIEGPVAGGRRGYPFCASLRDLAEKDYVEAEFFMTGEALQYEPEGELDETGKWSVSPGARAPYTTRLLVRRPRESGQFNGTVILYWTNVSAGFENIDDSEVLYDGFALIAVSAQQAGIDGFAAAPLGLKAWDPERYGSLSHPGDSYSFDIFTQAAKVAADPETRKGADPLGGLQVRKIVALGASQSASRLVTYANAIQPLERALDAIVATVSFGVGAPLADRIYENVNEVEYTATGMRNIGVPPTRVRDDLTTPVMIVNSETEVLPSYYVRQPDSDYFRLWEVAGATHAPGTMREQRIKLLERDGLPNFLAALPFAPSQIDIVAITAAAIHHVHRWMSDGTPPPIMPRIAVAGDPPHILQDRFGIALGGIRLPDVAAPIAVNTSQSENMTGFSGLAGRSTPLSEQQLNDLYPSRETYVAAVKQSVDALVRAGALLERDGDAMIAKAKTVAMNW